MSGLEKEKEIIKQGLNSVTARNAQLEQSLIALQEQVKALAAENGISVNAWGERNHCHIIEIVERRTGKSPGSPTVASAA